MNSVLLLLSPQWLTWRNGLRRGHHGWARRVSLIILALCFWVGTFYVVRRVLDYFQSVHELGPALAYQLLMLILLTFLSMLLFSNLITALSAFFLARDLDLLMSSPLPHGAFYYARLITTTVSSSWMVLFFSLPIFAAYESVFGGGIVFYLWVLLCLPLFLIIPASVGVFVTHLLVYFLPARRIRDMLFFVGLFAFIVIYLLFRFSQPERLVHPESFGHFVQFLSAMETPSSPYLPSSWSAEIFARTLFKRDTDQGFFYGLLASYALFFPLVTSWLSSAVYLDGWSKAQESTQGRRKYKRLDDLVTLCTRPFPAVMRAIIIKDLKTFMRDSTQWSQLFLLLALIVVYLYNFKVLPLDRSPMPLGAIRTFVSFANLALAGFVLSAVAVRFAFPAVSLEGRAFWLLQTAPISLKSVLWSKFWLTLIPLLFMGEVLVIASNLMLHTATWIMVLSVTTIFLMTFGVSAICVGVGAIYPKFAYEHAAEIPTSFGGAVCMILSAAYVAVTVMLEAWPIYLLSSDALRSGGAATRSLWLIAPVIAVVAILTGFAAIAALRLGLKKLDQLKT